MPEDYAKWGAVGGYVYVEGFGGAFVCDCSDGTYGVDVGPALADLIAREHNSLPSLREQLRDKDAEIERLKVILRDEVDYYATRRDLGGQDTGGRRSADQGDLDDAALGKPGGDRGEEVRNP